MRYFALVVGIVITVVWAITFLADIFIADFIPSPFVNTAMMLIAGTFFGRAAVKYFNGEKKGD